MSLLHGTVRPARLIAVGASLALAVGAFAVSPGLTSAKAAAPDTAAPGPLWVWASFGAEHPVVGGTARLIGDGDVVLATDTTNGHGRVNFPGAQVPTRFGVTVTGGTVDGKPNTTTLLTIGTRVEDRFALVPVTPITTMAVGVAKARKIDFPAAEAAVMKAAGYPTFITAADIAATPRIFDAQAFASSAKRAGGPAKAMAAAAQRIAKGTPIPDLNALPAPGSRPTERSLTLKGRTNGPTLKGRTSEITLGEQLMMTVLDGVSSGGAKAVIGSVMADPTVTPAQFSSLAGQVAEIASQLAALANEVTALFDQQTVTIIESAMGNATSQTTNNWQAYNWWLSGTDPYGDVTNTTQDTINFAQTIEDQVGSTINEFDLLFASPGQTGLIPALYTAQASSNPWWNESDINDLQLTIDYYGTLQAQASALLAEAWQLPNWQGTKGSSYTNAWMNGVYGPQNSNIYLSYPQDIPAGQVYVPSMKRMYTLSPYTTPNLVVHQEMSKNATTTQQGPPSSCSSDTEEAPNGWGTYTPNTVSASTMEGWWTAAMPTGNTIGDTDVFSILSKPKSNGSTALQSLQPAAPGAKVMVTAESSNSISLGTNSSQTTVMGITTVTPKKPSYWNGWMWCWSKTVSMTDTSKWTLNPAWTGSNKNVFPDTYQWPVGVLSYVSTTIGYVVPPPLPTPSVSPAPVSTSSPTSSASPSPSPKLTASSSPSPSPTSS